MARQATLMEIRADGERNEARRRRGQVQHLHAVLDALGWDLARAEIHRLTGARVRDVDQALEALGRAGNPHWSPVDF